MARRSPRRSPKMSLRTHARRLASCALRGRGLISDRASWLEEWCPTCRVAPGARCRNPYARRLARRRTCTWRAGGERERSRSARPYRASRAARPRDAWHRGCIRRGCGRAEIELLFGESVWRELKARGATIATVPFSGRAGRGGRIDRLALSRRSLPRRLPRTRRQRDVVHTVLRGGEQRQHRESHRRLYDHSLSRDTRGARPGSGAAGVGQPLRTWRSVD